MNQEQKALAELRNLHGRIGELGRQLHEAEESARDAQRKAADAAGTAEFEQALSSVPIATARVAALGLAKAKLETGLMPAALAAVEERRQDWLQQAAKIRSDVESVHRKVNEHLEKIAALLGVEKIPLGLLFVGAMVSLDPIDPRVFPQDRVHLQPTTMEALQRADAIHRKAVDLEHFGDARDAEAQAILASLAAETIAETKPEGGVSLVGRIVSGFRKPKTVDSATEVA